MKVEDIMSKAIVVEDDLSLKQASKIMSDKEVGYLIILKNGKIAGIITERDVLRNIDKLSEKVSKIMTREVITIEENESLDNAAILMTKKKIKKLPVVHKGSLAGIITATDIIANSEEMNENYLLD